MTLLLFVVPLILGLALKGKLASRRIHLAVTDFFFPVLILNLLLTDPPAPTALVASAAALMLHLLLMTPLGFLAARLLRRPKGEIVLPVVFMNSGFLGIAATLLIGGEESARYAVLYDEAMTIAIYTYGLALILPGGVRRGAVEIFKAPAFWAFLAALGLGWAGLIPPQSVLVPLGWLGRLTVPLALFAVGLDLSAKASDIPAAAAASMLRLAGGTVAALVTIRLAGFACANDLVSVRFASVLADPAFTRMVLIEGMMPSAVFSAILPARYGAGGPFASAIVLVSTLMYPLWWLIASRAM